MSVLITGMEMPENGSCIQIVIDDDGKVYPSVEKCILKMGSIAKAVPVPPHGRFIDADEFLKRAIGTKCFRGDFALMLEELVGESTTIIPPSGGKEYE